MNFSKSLKTAVLCSFILAVAPMTSFALVRDTGQRCIPITVCTEYEDPKGGFTIIVCREVQYCYPT